VAFNIRIVLVLSVIFIAHDVQKNEQVNLYIKLHVYWFICQPVCWISCCQHADHILKKLPTADKWFSRPHIINFKYKYQF